MYKYILVLFWFWVGFLDRIGLIDEINIVGLPSTK